MLSPDKGEHRGFLLCIVVYKRLVVNRISLEKKARTILNLIVVFLLVAILFGYNRCIKVNRGGQKVVNKAFNNLLKHLGSLNPTQKEKHTIG